MVLCQGSITYISLFLEILSPAKILSKDFQGEQIDLVKTVDYLKRANGQFARIKDKEYYELPFVNRFTCKGVEGYFAYS